MLVVHYVSVGSVPEVLQFAGDSPFWKDTVNGDLAGELEKQGRIRASCHFIWRLGD
jgi:hypothetical protein